MYPCLSNDCGFRIYVSCLQYCMTRNTNSLLKPMLSAQSHKITTWLLMCVLWFNLLHMTKKFHHIPCIKCKELLKLKHLNPPQSQQVAEGRVLATRAYSTRGSSKSKETACRTLMAPEYIEPQNK